MDREAQRDLEILSTIAGGGPVTQRGLAQKLGIALGLANLYLKRLVLKGYVKVTTIPPSRIKYLLTPKGIAEKTRLTYEYMDYSLHLYRQTRRALRETLGPLAQQGCRRVIIYGTGEAAELAYLTLKELALELVGVMDGGGKGGAFLGLPVRAPADFSAESADVIIAAAFSPAHGLIQQLIEQGIPREKIVSLTGGQL